MSDQTRGMPGDRLTDPDDPLRRDPVSRRPGTLEAPTTRPEDSRLDEPLAREARPYAPGAHDPRPHDAGSAHDTGEPTRQMQVEEAARDALRGLRDLDNRIKLLVAMAAMLALSLLLLIVLLAQHRGAEAVDEVMVEGTPCVVISGDEVNQLYCRR